ncbi:MAG: hypothetical protein K9J16_03280 [Melioribacteraceae bacterium]|nr:hypothetical protein [Melioribacteraceae bacterium]MCF8355852.1 hypothetical protein [Melioribacteraceae bacterium]MCF8392573.1 hypothetical protein [Melioribacteraceae bacterium]MCF8418555.1 hypothetical protein [Melioribacteraceae bacterium]
MDQIKTKIRDIIESVVKNHNYFLIELLFRGNPNEQILEVYVDNETGVTTDVCAVISKEISAVIDSLELIGFNYRLDVSSPGVGRGLKFIEQFPKHVGRNFKIKHDIDGKNEKFEGKLLNINGDDLTFETTKGELIVNFNNVKEAKVLISF